MSTLPLRFRHCALAAAWSGLGLLVGLPVPSLTATDAVEAHAASTAPAAPVVAPLARAASTSAAASAASAPASVPTAATPHAPHPGSPASSAASAPSAQPSLPATDPLELVRQRLTEKLGARRARPDASPYDIKIAGRAPGAAPADRRTVRPGAGGTSAATEASLAEPARPRHPDEPLWGYEPDNGPGTWAALRPDYAGCARGERQSPIDIRGGIRVQLEPIRFDYRVGAFQVVDTGRTVQADLPAGNAIELGGRRYELKSLQFHRPAEHRIDGRSYEMDVQFVHQDVEGRVAIVAVPFEIGEPQAAVQAVWNSLPLERHAPVPAFQPLDPAQLLPQDRGYHTYLGSRTTPPCDEGVLWLVMRQPLALSAAQLDIFARLYPMNARPLQAVAGRLIKGSE